MTPLSFPPWPSVPPAHGGVELRAVREGDVNMARELSTDPYVPITGSLPSYASEGQALEWVQRQRDRHTDHAGFSFTVVKAFTGQPVGHCGLWLKELSEGRATAGYSIIPSARGKGLAAEALSALTAFGWTVPHLFRIALYIEPWNIGSVRTAERAGYAREGLLRSHQVIDGKRCDMLLYATVRSAG